MMPNLRLHAVLKLPDPGYVSDSNFAGDDT